ncbi:MAG: cyclase family protein [Bacteroidia bacterium]|nr:cyclase family protein [Bacteroidia bacterium]
MKIITQWQHKNWEINLGSPIDISLALVNGEHNPNAFHIPSPRFEPIVVGDFVGSVAQGSGANCENISFNAHGNGTHTECIGHITRERISINDSLKNFHFMAQVKSFPLEQQASGDWLVNLPKQNNWLQEGVQALIIRTLPNQEVKKTQHYSRQNPPYMSPELAKFLVQNGIEHLLIDLPSVDREEDSGAMLAHKAFWNYPENPRMQATISEMIFVPNEVPDGIYLLNIQIASFGSDASPSKPVIYAMQELV